MAEEERLDKFMWAVRAFKTRSEATAACTGGKVKLNGSNAKPSKGVKRGDTVAFRRGAALFTYKVKDLTDNRIGAKLLPDFVEDLTTEEELQKLHAPVETFFVTRERGAGRPTKKDRRTLDALWEDLEEE